MDSYALEESKNMYANTKQEVLKYKKNPIKGKVHPIMCHEVRWGIEVPLYFFLNVSARWEWVVNAIPQLFAPGNKPVANV